MHLQCIFTPGCGRVVEDGQKWQGHSSQAWLCRGRRETFSTRASKKSSLDHPASLRRRASMCCTRRSPSAERAFVRARASVRRRSADHRFARAACFWVTVVFAGVLRFMARVYHTVVTTMHSVPNFLAVTFLPQLCNKALPGVTVEMNGVPTRSESQGSKQSAGRASTVPMPEAHVFHTEERKRRI